jgi:hypothetical protein
MRLKIINADKVLPLSRVCYFRVITNDLEINLGSRYL